MARYISEKRCDDPVGMALDLLGSEHVDIADGRARRYTIDRAWRGQRAWRLLRRLRPLVCHFLVVELVKQGAAFYVCGDGRRMAPAVYETCLHIYQEATNATAAEAEVWLSEMQHTHARYIADVFA